MMGALSPEGFKTKALLQVQEIVMPMLAKLMEALNKPKAEGGLLEEGDYGACFAVVPHNGKSIPMILTLKFDKETGQMIVKDKIHISELNNLLDNGPKQLEQGSPEQTGGDAQGGDEETPVGQ